MKFLYNALFISDSHFPTHNKVILEGYNAKIFKLIRAKKPKYKKIIHIGDMVNFDDFTSHEQPAGKQLESLQTLELIEDFNSNLRLSAPIAEIIELEGNHELRLERYLVRNAPHLIQFKELTVPHLFKLAKYNIKWKPYRERLVIDGLKVTHGSIVRPESGNSARGELKAARYNTGISGHTHRQAWIKDVNVAWMELGHTADPDYAVSAKYMADKDPNWNPGFGEGTCCIDDDGNFHWFLRPIEIKDNCFIVDGKLY